MTFRWAAVHLLPILLIPPIVRYLQGRLEPHAISAVAYLVLIACVAGGQSAALRRRSRSLANAWLPATIAGLAAAWACGLVRRLLENRSVGFSPTVLRPPVSKTQ
jgi:hypothetical protein